MYDRVNSRLDDTSPQYCRHLATVLRTAAKSSAEIIDVRAPAITDLQTYISVSKAHLFVLIFEHLYSTKNNFFRLYHLTSLFKDINAFSFAYQLLTKSLP